MNTSITLYKIPFTKEMNYKFHDKSVFLQWINSLDSGRITKNDFQFLRMEKEISIKINFTQELTYLPDGTFNYMVVKAMGDNQATNYFFYFINECKQISPMCLGISAEMDVLNTFNFETYHGEFLNNFKEYGRYKIDKRSVLNRLHKPRIVARDKTYNKTIPLTYEEVYYEQSLFFDGEGTEATYHTYYYVDYLKLRELITNGDIDDGDIWFSGWIKTTESGDTKLGVFELYNEVGTLLGTYETITFYWTGITATSIEGTNDYYEFSNYPEIFIRYVRYEDDPNLVEVYYSQSGELEQIQYLLENVITRKRDTNNYSYERIIDDIPENINPYLFKKEEHDLLSTDNYNTWYIIYANHNTPANPSDTEATYINPVDIMFSSDEAYSITASGNRPYELNVKDPLLPFVINEAEILMIRYADINATGYIDINGTQYHLTDIQATIQSDYNAILILRRNNNSSKFEFWGWKMTTTDVGNTATKIGEYSSCIISGVNEAHYRKTTFPDLYVNDVSTNDYNGIIYSPLIYLNTGTESSSGEATAIYSLDKTDPKLIKIINLPYAPLDVLEYKTEILPSNMEYNASFHLLKLKDNSQTEFDRVLQFTSGSPYDDIMINSDEHDIIVSPKRTDSRDKLYESKLYASEFSVNKFVYDSFVFDFRLELIDIHSMIPNWNGMFNVRYVVSKNVSSKFMFQFNDYVYMKYELQNYNNVLIVERDNEIALYTNAYINYLRMGYNFDMKQNERNNAVNWASVALSLIGSVASFASSGITNGVGIASGITLATSTLANLGRTIAVTKSNDENLQAKMLQNQMQSSSVTGTNDIDLLRAYSGNKAKLVKYDMNDGMKEAVYNLFYYCGYSCNKRYSEVSNFHTRVNFNFIQGELIIEQANFDKDIQDEIVKKWKEGFTIIWTYNSSYILPTDLKENWETYLMEE